MSKKSNLVRGFKKKAEDKSIYLRKENQKQDFERLPARTLAEILGVIIKFPRDVPGINKTTLNALCKSNAGWSAITLEENGNVLVILNPAHAPNRIESDIFHELAHLLCEHTMSGFETLNGFPLRIYDTVQEEEAAWLGGCLHIPRKGLEWALRNRMDKIAISKYYVASLQMVEYRINSTGVKHQYRYSKI